MSRRNKHKYGLPTPEAAPALAAAVAEDHDTKILPRDLYRAEEVDFPPQTMAASLGQRISEYINRFATEHDAALLSVHPIKTSTTFLFIWDMT